MPVGEAEVELFADAQRVNPTDNRERAGGWGPGSGGGEVPRASRVASVAESVQDPASESKAESG